MSIRWTVITWNLGRFMERLLPIINNILLFVFTERSVRQNLSENCLQLVLVADNYSKIDHFRHNWYSIHNYDDQDIELITKRFMMISVNRTKANKLIGKLIMIHLILIMQETNVKSLNFNAFIKCRFNVCRLSFTAHADKKWYHMSMFIIMLITYYKLSGEFCDIFCYVSSKWRLQEICFYSFYVISFLWNFSAMQKVT